MIDHQEERTTMFPQPLTTKEIDHKKQEQLAILRQAKLTDVLSNVFFLVAAASLVFTLVFGAAATAQLYLKGKIESSLIDFLILTCVVAIPSVLITIKTGFKESEDPLSGVINCISKNGDHFSFSTSLK